MFPMKSGRQIDQLVRFLCNDEGLVTLEWVALAAAVIVLAIGTVIVIQGQLNTAASTVGSAIVSTVQSNS
jgi:Flp pilus assembly pilin Flp